MPTCASWGWPRTTRPRAQKRPQAGGLPAYTTEDITAELTDKNSDFKSLLEEVEHLQGKKCSVTEVRILLELFDHLAMPPEVLLILTARLIEQTEAKYGRAGSPA